MTDGTCTGCAPSEVDIRFSIRMQVFGIVQLTSIAYGRRSNVVSACSIQYAASRLATVDALQTLDAC